MDLSSTFENLVDAVIEKLTAGRKERALLVDDADESSLPFGWVALTIATILTEYPSGVTKAVLLSEIERRFDEGNVHSADRKRATITRLLESKTIRAEDIFECSIANVRYVQGTQTCLLSLRDLVRKGSSTHTGDHGVEMYLHQKYSSLMTEGQISKGHVVRIIGAKMVDRMSSQLTLLPTPYMTFLLDRSAQPSQFPQVLKNIDFSSLQDEDHNILFKAIDIGQVEKATAPGKIKQLKIHLREIRGTEPSEAFFVLWDEQVVLAELFKRGDVLGIYRPYIGPAGPHNGWQQPPFLEYGSATVVFYEPYETQKELVHSSSQVRGAHVSQTLPRDDEGNLDYRVFAPRFTVDMLRPKQVNISLFGRVETVYAQNNAFILADHTGKTAVHLCPTLFSKISPKESHCVLLSHLSTKGEKSVVVLGSVREGTKVADLNILTGILNCEAFWNPVSLSHPRYFSFQCLATIVAVSFDPGTQVVSWTLSDGTGEIKASVPKRLMLEALKISKGAFDRSTDPIRQELVQVMVCKEFRFIISQNQRGFHIDAITERNPVADLRRFLDKLKH